MGSSLEGPRQMAATLPRIVFLAGSLDLGGAERQLYYKASALRRMGASVRVISFAGKDWEQPLREAGVEVISIARRRTPLSRVLAILKELRRQPADVLQGVHFFVSPHACVAARLAGITEICAVQSSLEAELEKLPAGFGWMTLRAARWIVCNSMASREEARLRGVPEGRLCYCANAVDLSVFHPPAEPVDGGRLRIVAVGRLVRLKRFDRFLRIVAALRRSRDVEAVLVGDGPLRGELEKTAASLGLTAPDFRVEAVEPRAAPEVYRGATLLVQTSETEGMANVVLEAMASGLPVVSTRAGGTAEAVEDGVTGFLVDEEDLDGFEDRIGGLLDDPALRRRMGAEGRRRIERDYSLDGLPERLRELYGRVWAAG